MNLFDEIYDKYKGSGFEFTYKNKKLSGSKTIFKKDVIKIDQSKRNNDEIPMFIKCENCNNYMDFKVGKNDNLDGKWVCPSCSSEVKERSVYVKLNNENGNYY